MARPRPRQIATLVGPASAVVLVLAVLLSAGSAEATRALGMRWRTLATENFDIHYYQGGEALAARVARVAEHAHAELSPLFGLRLSNRCQVVLTDHLDVANGFARTMPYDRITLHAYPPEPDGNLGNYDDYLHLLFFHEYTHLLHLNTVGGLPGVINTVLGKTYLPNTVLPKWYIEGIAVTMESRATGRGRVGSARTRMVLRAAHRDGTWLTLSELTDAPLRRPGAGAFYLYGGEFVSWIIDQVGLEPVVEFQRAYGRHPVPYALNILARRTIGRDWAELYDEWSATLQAEERGRLAAIRARGVVEGRALTTKAEEHESPRFSPDGRLLAYVESDGDTRRNIRVMDLERGVSRRVRDCDGVCRDLAWSPDGRALYFSEPRYHRTVYLYRDLYRLPLDGGAPERLTTGARVRGLDVSADGRVAYVTTEMGTTSLVVREPDGETRVVRPPNGYDHLAGPRWSPDGGEIAYSASVDSDGRRDLFVIDAPERDTARGPHLSPATPRRLTWDHALHMHPTWSPDGRHLLYSADYDGVYDIHALRLEDGARFRITSAETGAFAPDVSPDGARLAFLLYGGHGYDIHALPLALDQVSARDRAVAAPPEVPPYEPPATTVTRESGYNPLVTIWPRRIGPTWRLSAAGLDNVGAELSGQDALDHHKWTAAIDYSLNSSLLSEALSYQYLRLPVDLGLSFSHFERRRWAFMHNQERNYRERVMSGSVDLRVPFPHVRVPVAVGLGYSLRWAKAVDRPPHRPEPDDLVPHIPSDGLLAGPYLSLSYSDLTHTRYGIAPRAGRSLSLRLSANHPYFGSDHLTYGVRGTWREYLAAPWHRRHVFALRATAGARFGSREQRGNFSLGGLPDQDLLMALINEEPLSGAHLRGYPTGRFSGRHMYLLNAEYRFPLLDLFVGLDTLPVWARRLTGALFVDVGSAFEGALGERAPRTGLGAELRLNTTLFYRFAANFRLGYAHGLQRGGEHQVYLILGGSP